MNKRKLAAVIAAAAAALLSAAAALAQENDGLEGLRPPDAKPNVWYLEGYPDWSGQWRFTGPNQWPLRAQAPLTEEGKAINAAGLADREAGGQGGDPTWRCIPPGMPRNMKAIGVFDITITPEHTLMYFEYQSQVRRIYTDGRGYPEYLEPTFNGYSIGEWLDTDNNGALDTLTIETRGLKNPRSYDSGGLPLGDTDVIRERVWLDESTGLLHDELTIEDSLLTEPWTSSLEYARNHEPYWSEYVCQEGNLLIEVGGQMYMLSHDGSTLYPTTPNQPPPAYSGGN
ncbi:MAG: hypothetical protein LBE21_10345 [Pseudomonadales bacterium]|jgi:hypothetical protein|nr:hypothetical protein [Pseudomonadales bacterium]